MVDNPWGGAKREEKFEDEKNPFKNTTFNKKVNPEDEVGVAIDDIPERVNIATQNTFIDVDQIIGMTFLKLSDTPELYSGQRGRSVVVNSTEDGLVFTHIDECFWTQIGSRIYYMKGYVGVGLANPAFDFDVAGNINYTDTVYYGGAKFIQNVPTSNIFIGVEAIGSGNHVATTSYQNTSLGYATLQDLTTGVNNTAIGYSALSNVTTASNNTAVGRLAGGGIISAHYSTFVGARAGELATGEKLTLVGYRAGGDAMTGLGNTCIGYRSGYKITSGFDNTSVGQSSAAAITTGEGNTFLGENAGSTIASGDGNVFLGRDTAGTSAMNSSIAIGQSATCTASNQMVIGSSTANINDIYIGANVFTTVPPDITIQPSGEFSTNQAGAVFNIAGGKATGNAEGGAIVFKISVAGGSGSTLQSLAEVARFDSDGLTLAGFSPDETIEDFLHDVTGNGVLDAITVSDQGGLNVQWSAGEVYVDDTIIVTDARGSNLAMTDNATNYLYATVAGDTTLQVSTTHPSGEYAMVAIVYTYSGDIEYLYHKPLNHHLLNNIDLSLEELHAELVYSGLIVAADADGTNANDFTIATGAYYLLGHEKITVPSIIYSAGVGHGDNNLSRYYHSGGSWAKESSNGVDFGFWDDGTNKDTVQAGKWYCGFVFVEGTGSVEYVYPQTEHASQAAANDEAVTYPPSHQGYVIPLARFIFRGGAAAFGATAYFVDIRPIHLGTSLAGAVQSLWATFTADSGSASASDSLDSFAFVGGTGVSTAIAGDVLTITGTASVPYGAFEEDGNGDWQPVLGAVHDAFFEKDVNDDVMVRDVLFGVDSNGDVFPAV